MLRKDLEGFKAGSIVPIEPGVMDKAEAEANAYWLQWKKRRRAAHDIVDMICEGMEKSRKEVFELIGLETDEEYNVAVD